jgi:predicted ATPase/two-component sensor histidine kinase
VINTAPGRTSPTDEGSPDHRATPGTVDIPDKLYGRRTTIRQLVSAYEEVADRGATELVLVSGISGIGKSAVVDELLRQVTVSGGLFAAGKCEQSSSDIPYATLAAALGRLLSDISSQGGAAIARWQPGLAAAVGRNGQILTALIPELELIIGAQPPAAPLPATEARHRFHRVFKRFLRALAEASRPLVLFIDDLQWIDAATVDLLGGALADAEVRCFLMLACYRSNEVDASHPLTGLIKSTMAAGTRVREIVLAPLRVDDIEALLRDGLPKDCQDVQSLAGVIHDLGAGSPFLSRQLIAALVESEQLRFDARLSAWTWDTEAIRAGLTAADISSLMTDRLARLPAAARQLLETLSCLGNRSDAATLAMLHAMPEHDVHAALSDVVGKGLLRRADDRYAFAHDRIQEAAYGLIPDAAQEAAHLRIGRAFREAHDELHLSENIFEVVNQLNRGVLLVVDPDERMTIARLNLAAAKAAKSSTAHASLRNYIGLGMALLPLDGWRHHPRLMFEFEFNFCESEFLLGNLSDAEQRLAKLATRDITLAERSSVTWLQITLLTAAGQLDRAVGECLSFLDRVGISWVPHPSQAAILEEFAPIREEIEAGSIDERFALPTISDPMQRIVLDVLTAVLPPAFFTDNNLVCLVLCRMAHISKAFGNSDASSLGYAYLGMVLGPRFGAWAAGFSFGQIGFRLSAEAGLDLFKPRVEMAFAYHVMPYSLPIAQGDRLLRAAFDTANDRGDLTYAGFSSCTLVSSLLFRGQPLAATQSEAAAKLKFVTAAKFGLIIEIISTQLRLVAALREITDDFPSFNDHEFNETNYEAYLAANPELSIAACWYWIRKLQLRLIGSDFAGAVSAASKAAPLIWTSGGHLELVEYHFCAGMAQAALCSDGDSRHVSGIRDHADQLARLAAQCPENFASRSALLKAELSRIDGHSFDALRLYQEAIDLSQQHGFLQIGALAHETAARFCLASGLSSAGCSHVAQARDLYVKYGAAAKVRQLQRTYTDLPPVIHVAAPVEGGVSQGLGYDTAPLLKIAVALSQEIGSDRLIETMMSVVLQSSNATRGLLILPHGDELRLEAEAVTADGSIVVSIPRQVLGDHHAPASVIRHVSASRQTILQDDVQASGDNAADRYLLAIRPKSLLCLPIAKRNKLLGILYLENGLTSFAFSEASLDLLTLLASQIAISLENASLEEKESLLKEVHHRVKNNLQLITSLLNLQAARASDPAISGLFEDSRNRVRSMALVHENLYRAGNLARVSMGPHLRSLCAQLFRSFAFRQQRITFSPDIDDIQLDLDRAISCGLVVNELVSNALKHAFPEDMVGTILVGLVHGGEGLLELSVEDNGMGLPTGGVSTGSLGLQLVEDLTHQLHGKLFISSVKGTRFLIRFPRDDD